MGSPVIETPLADSTNGFKYKHTVLENGLEMLAISDPKSTKGAASMDCKVGQLHEGDDVPGLAHFCEHMMFLGTEKYPEEGEYESYVTRNGGRLNAYTASENTCFSFEVSDESLDGALDRFAQFFIAPLFTETATGRELMAVESEFQRSRASEGFHFSTSFLKRLINKDHPLHRFGAGNRETLRDIPKEKGINVRERLLAFQKAHYRVRNLRLCVYSSASCDDTIAMTRKHFTGITNESEAPSNHTPPWGERAIFDSDAFRKLYYVKTVTHTPGLILLWDTQFSYGSYLSKPSGMVSHLLGHECEGTIIYVLKKRGWATALVAGPFAEVDAERSIFFLEISLTAEGRKHVREIINLVFIYVEIVKEGISSAVHHELVSLMTSTFNFTDQSRSPFSRTLDCAAAMNKFPPEHIISGDVLMFEEDLEKVRQLAAALTPDTVILAVKRKEFEDGTAPVPLDQDGLFVKEQYGAWDIPSEWLEGWRNVKLADGAEHDLRMPDLNTFLAETFDVHESTEQDTNVPQRILDTCRNHTAEAKQGAEVEVWHWKDATFLVPKSYLMLGLSSPIVSSSLQNHVLAKLYADVLTELDVTTSYFASLGLLDLAFSSITQGIRIGMGGLDEKLPVLLESVLRRINKLRVLDDDEFAIFESQRQKYINNVKTYRSQQPVTHAQDSVSGLIKRPHNNPEQQLKATERLTRADMDRFIRDFRSSLRVVLVGGGNITRDRVQNLAKDIPTWFDWSDSFAPQTAYTFDPRIHILPAGRKLIVPVLHPDPSNTNAAAYHHIQLGAVDTHTVACTYVFEALVEHIFFHNLRTVEQLGYLVLSSAQISEGIVNFLFIVQSALCGPWYAYTRIECFLQALDGWMGELGEGDFRKILNATIQKQSDPPKGIMEIVNKWFTQIEKQTLRFNLKQDVIEALKGLTLDDLKAFYRERISVNSAQKRAVSSLVYTSASHQKEEFDGIVSRWKAIESVGATPLFLKETRRLAEKMCFVKKDGDHVESTDTKEDNKDHLLHINVGDGAGEIDVEYVMRTGELQLHLPSFASRPPV